MFIENRVPFPTWNFNNVILEHYLHMLYICIENKIYSFELLPTICLFLNCSLVYSTGFRLKLLMSMSTESHLLGFRVNENVRRSPSPGAKSLHNSKHTLPSRRLVLYIQWYLIKFFFLFCMSILKIFTSFNSIAVSLHAWPLCFYCKEFIWQNWQIFFFAWKSHFTVKKLILNPKPHEPFVWITLPLPKVI